ncbi:MFS transporter [Embleya hyalina]|uniref:MFS transporter n=1 Tax=Embleya hyalina TaxID=516124 RepID=A0A401Z6H8_9ACTN|nr:MFS transporter [Embleya hyalina]GCE02454.1 MFS transporter [Embleya hyalina]
MLAVLRNRTYRRLFTAQIVALVGTGLATVALSLLAYDIAGADASVVLGTALAIKMVAYVAISPAAGALAHRVSRRGLLAAMDLVRAFVALALPFVTQVWQIYVLILLLQGASAIFTPTFQAGIPELLPEEGEYTAALSMSRLAYDLESLFSPALAALLLQLVSYHWLFAGTTVGFVASAALVVSVVLPRPAPAPAPSPSAPVERERVEGVRGRYARAGLGFRLFRETPGLRALLALDLAVAAASAIVFVNTVVLVREHFGRSAGAVSLALGAYGGGSMVAALLLPRLLRRFADRGVMSAAACALPVVLAAVAGITAAAPNTLSWVLLLVAWAAIGAACSLVLTPAGRVIRRSAGAVDLPAAFAAQFSLSHGCWLVTYPLAGWLAAGAGLPVTAVVLGGIALAGVAGAAACRPRRGHAELVHVHRDLPADHPHLADAVPSAGGWRHRHAYVIDRHHHRPDALSERA